MKKKKKQIGAYVIGGSPSRHSLHPFNLKNHKEVGDWLNLHFGSFTLQLEKKEKKLSYFKNKKNW